MNSLQFVHAWVLFLVWVVPLIGVWWFILDRRHEERLAALVSPAMQSKLLPPASRVRRRWQAGLILTGLLLLLVAAARPQWGTQEVAIQKRGREVLIALDVSRSMLANDVRPNRLLRAKADVLDLIKDLQGDRAGILAFRHRAILVCPLTTDYAYLRQSLEGVSPDSAPAGETDLGDAITKALDTFDAESGSHKAIVLITDGEDLAGNAQKAAEAAAKRAVPVFTVGLGSRSGARIPDPQDKRQSIRHQGSDVVSKLDNATLFTIAKTTGGAYIPIETAGMGSVTLGTLYRDHLRKIAAQDFEETLKYRRVERFQWFLLPALVLLLAGTALSRGRLAAASTRNPPRTPSPLRDLNPPSPVLKALCVLLTVMPCAWSVEPPAPDPVQSTPTNTPAETRSVRPGLDGARQAQRLYRLGRYEEAAETYLQAAQGLSRPLQKRFRFNAAVAFYKAGRFKDASDLFGEIALDDTGTDPAAAQGLGAALFRASTPTNGADAANLAEATRTLRDAGEAFKSALRTQGDLETARHDLAVVLKALPALEEEAHIAELMETYGRQPAFAVASEMLSRQRRLHRSVRPAFTNDSPAQVAQLEALAEEQNQIADLWIPLKGQMLDALSREAASNTNAQQMAAVFTQLAERTRDTMKETSSLLRDLDRRSFESSASAETGVYHAWKAIAPYAPLLTEAIQRQTNAILPNSATPPPSAMTLDLMAYDQRETHDLTCLFIDRFQEQVPESACTNAPSTPNAPATNSPPQGLSLQDRRKILALSDQATNAQQAAEQRMAAGRHVDALPAQRNSHACLVEILKLLPKQAQQQQDENRQDPKESQEQKEKQEQPQQQPQTAPQSDPQKEPPAEQKDDSDSKKEDTPEDVKQILDKAVQREKDHEAKKRREMGQIPLSPHERDW